MNTYSHPNNFGRLTSEFDCNGLAMRNRDVLKKLQEHDHMAELFRTLASADIHGPAYCSDAVFVDGYRTALEFVKVIANNALKEIGDVDTAKRTAENSANSGTDIHSPKVFAR